MCGLAEVFGPPEFTAVLGGLSCDLCDEVGVDDEVLDDTQKRICDRTFREVGVVVLTLD
jgi:hypothetical protein